MLVLCPRILVLDAWRKQPQFQPQADDSHSVADWVWKQTTSIPGNAVLPRKHPKQELNKWSMPCLQPRSTSSKALFASAMLFVTLKLASFLLFLHSVSKSMTLSLTRSQMTEMKQITPELAKTCTKVQNAKQNPQTRMNKRKLRENCNQLLELLRATLLSANFSYATLSTLSYFQPSSATFSSATLSYSSRSYSSYSTLNYSTLSDIQVL